MSDAVSLGLDGLDGERLGEIHIWPGVTTFVGPNGSGKSRALRAASNKIVHALPAGTRPRLIVSGRLGPLDSYRGAIDAPGQQPGREMFVGHTSYRPNWHQIEGATGDLLVLDQRPDLMLKVEARLQAFLDRRLELAWGQNGLSVAIVPTKGGKKYSGGFEASGVLHLATLLASIYHDEISALFIDEPEISLHPQHQAFLRDELSRIAGDPRVDNSKKFVVIATHAPSMIAVATPADLGRLVLFKGPRQPPVQVTAHAAQAPKGRLASLMARLDSSHRHAFFAQHVVLVEGASDEIILEQLARRLDIPLLAASAQIVPVNGKSEFLPAFKLFRSLGKDVTILADLDALTDNVNLISALNAEPAAQAAAATAGHASLARLAADIRSSLVQLTDASWSKIAEYLEQHGYVTTTDETASGEVHKARSAFAGVLTEGPGSFEKLAPGAGWTSFHARATALFGLLDQVGCIVLRRGAVESYYAEPTANRGKPDEAANEAATFPSRCPANLATTYSEMVTALRRAADSRKVDENRHLRTLLGRAIGGAFQMMEKSTPSEEINAVAVSSAGNAIFKFTNRSDDSFLRLEIDIVSPLFRRATFPFVISQHENPFNIVREKLP